MEISDHLTCLLSNLYAGEEATVSTRHGTTEWFQIGKKVLQGCTWSLCLFNFYADYIMQNARLGAKMPSLLEGISTTSDMQNSVQFSSVTQSCLTVCNPMNHSTPGLPVHHQLLELPKLMSIESVMPSNHLTLCRPLLLLPSIFPNIRVFSNDSALGIRWPKYSK